MRFYSNLAYPIFALTLLFLRQPVWAQRSATLPSTAITPNAQMARVPIESLTSGSLSKDYMLGPGDLLTIQVADLEDAFKAEKPFAVDLAGELSLPIIGRVHAAGLTVTALEGEIRNRLGVILNNPDVAINVSSSSQQVAVLGAVTNPGIRQLNGPKTLFEVLSLAGGLRPDAGYQIKITRSLNSGRIPLPNAQLDPSGKFYTASVRVRSIINEQNSADNILILPGDNVSIPMAAQVYILGSVTKPGGVLLTDHESIPALQLLSTAEGLQKVAAADKAKILRLVAGSDQRIEVAVNLKQIFAGKMPDVQLQSNDILFVPSSRAKSTAYRAIDVIANPGSMVAIAGRY